MMSNRLDKVFLAHNSQLMVMVMHLSRAFSMCIYSNALYNTLWGTLPDCFMAQFTIFLVQQVEFTVDARPQHRELNALLFTNSVWVL